MNNVPRREKVRKGFTSPKGIAFLSSIAKTPTSEPTTPFHTETSSRKVSTTKKFKVDKYGAFIVPKEANWGLDHE